MYLGLPTSNFGSPKDSQKIFLGSSLVAAAEQPRSSKQTMTPIATESSIQRRLTILLQAKSSVSEVVLSYLNEECNKGFILLFPDICAVNKVLSLCFISAGKQDNTLPGISCKKKNNFCGGMPPEPPKCSGPMGLCNMAVGHVLHCYG